MNSAPMAYHEIWIEQCAAAQNIRKNFGLHSALDYLVGQKLFAFLHAAERDPLFAAEVPAFICEIRRLFSSKEVTDYLVGLEHSKYLAPHEPDLEPEYEEGLKEEDFGLENPVTGAEELLRFSRVRELLGISNDDAET